MSGQRAYAEAGCLPDELDTTKGRLAHSNVAISMNFAARCRVIDEGDPARAVYAIVSGQVALSQCLPDGRRQIVELIGAGDVFGFSSADVHSVSAETLTETQIHRFKRCKVEVVPALQFLMVERLQDQVCRLRDHALLLGRKDAVERVTTFLISRIARDVLTSGYPEGPTQVLVLLTRPEIADYLGLTAETVSRALSALKRAGLISYSKGRSDLVAVMNVRHLARETGSELVTGAEAKIHLSNRRRTIRVMRQG